jgi:hypothetical protein
MRGFSADVLHVHKIHITEKKTGMLRIVQGAKEPNPTKPLLEGNAVCKDLLVNE